MIREFAFPIANDVWEEGAFCLLQHKEYNQNDRFMVMIDRWHGLVLKEYERNYHDDSDFYAVVWNEEKQCPQDIMFATTRAWTYPCGCDVDATQEVIAKYTAYLEEKKAAWSVYNAKLAWFIPKLGSIARSTTTRGKAKGKQGEITWIGESNYSSDKLVRIAGVYVEISRIELWDERTEEWVKPAAYSRTFKCWTVPETTLPSPI